MLSDSETAAGESSVEPLGALLSSQTETRGFPESAGGSLVTKPFPNVFEEPLKNLQTQVLVVLVIEGENEQALDLLVRRARIFSCYALPQLLWTRVHVLGLLIVWTDSLGRPSTPADDLVAKQKQPQAE
jgi:hypothetical protein